MGPVRFLLAYARELKAADEARVRFVDEFELLHDHELARRAGSSERDLGYRWREQRRLFSLTIGFRHRFPAFQFDGRGQPLEVISLVLAELAPHRQSFDHGWETALWLASGNEALAGERPVDLLSSNPDAVVAAARRG
jgi:hypothetical protein